MTITDADIEAARRYWAGWSNNQPVGPDGEFHSLVHAFARHREAAPNWKPMTDTAWLDGRDVVLFVHGMEVHARYCPGEWSAENPVHPSEYSGAVWSCFDDAFQLEIEETHKPEDWFHDGATHWREPTPPTEEPTNAQ